MQCASLLSACQLPWLRHQDSCYSSINEPANWKKAKEGCISRNSQLVTIASNEENSFVASVANNLSWIGAQWSESLLDYTWVDGSGITFIESWKSKQKKRSLCVGVCESSASDLCNRSGEWQQEDCAHLKPFVCEKKSKCQTYRERNYS